MIGRGCWPADALFLSGPFNESGGNAVGLLHEQVVEPVVFALQPVEQPDVGRGEHQELFFSDGGDDLVRDFFRRHGPL